MPENVRTLTIETNAKFSDLKGLPNSDAVASKVPQEDRVKMSTETESSIQYDSGTEASYTIKAVGEDKHSEITFRLTDKDSGPGIFIAAAEAIALLQSKDHNHVLGFKLTGEVADTRACEAALLKGLNKLILPPLEEGFSSSQQVDIVNEESGEEEEEEQNFVISFLTAAAEKIRSALKFIKDKIVAFFSGIKNRLFPAKAASTSVPAAPVIVPITTPPVVQTPAPPAVVPPAVTTPPAPPLPEDEAIQRAANEKVKAAVAAGSLDADFSSEEEWSKSEFKKIAENAEDVYKVVAVENKDTKSEAFISARKAFDERPKEAVYKRKYTMAFNKAIAQCGEGRDYTVNGLCLPRKIVNVQGKNNNCGANALLHIMLENLEAFDTEPDFEGLKTDAVPPLSLLEALKAKLLEDHNKNNQLTADTALKEKLDKLDAKTIQEQIKKLYPSPQAQEDAFGPVVRKHIAMKLRYNNDYYGKFAEAVLPMIDQSWDSVLYNSKDFQAYRTSLTSEKPDRSKEQDFFADRYSRLADEKNGLMITQYELADYAAIMGIDLRFYVREQSKDTCEVHWMLDVLNEKGELDETKVRAGVVYLGFDGKFVTRRELDGPILRGTLLEHMVKEIPNNSAPTEAREKWLKDNKNRILSSSPVEVNLPEPIYVPGARVAEDVNKARVKEKKEKLQFKFAANIVNINTSHWQYDLTPCMPRAAPEVGADRSTGPTLG